MYVLLELKNVRHTWVKYLDLDHIVQKNLNLDYLPPVSMFLITFLYIELLSHSYPHMRSHKNKFSDRSSGLSRSHI